MSIKLTLIGSKGRMGQTILNLASKDKEWDVVGTIDEGDDLEQGIQRADVVIDFSHHSITEKIAKLCVDNKKSLVIGTTGHSAETKKTVLSHSNQIPLIMASNYSVGVNVLFHLTREAAGALGEGFDLEVVEMHHRHKKDAPSGTARSLVEILQDVRNHSNDEWLRHGRVGDVGARTQQEIGVHALRGGDVVGDHTVVFATDGERVELTHRASSRETFASGALRAARWIHGKPAGCYDMSDVLGLKKR